MAVTVTRETIQQRMELNNNIVGNADIMWKNSFNFISKHPVLFLKTAYGAQKINF